MSDQTQPSLESTQPAKPKRRIKLGRFFLGLLGLIVLIALGGLGGYFQGIDDRMDAEAVVVSQQLVDQYALALVDIQSGNYGAAQQRLEYIIQNYPSFPGAPEKLAEVMVLAQIPTATLPPTPTATPDLSGVEEIFQRASQYMNIMDWPNAIANLDTLRRKDPTYRAAEVDGMYYFALRNYGADLIKQGNLEGGIYHLTLAERFGPLDNTANGLREGARNYVLAASFWELDWKNAVNYFFQVYSGWPAMWDGTMAASERYRIAAMRFGDELFAQENYCGATQQYQNSAALGTLDAESLKRANVSYSKCFPAQLVTPTFPVPLP